MTRIGDGELATRGKRANLLFTVRCPPYGRRGLEKGELLREVS